VVKKLIPLAIFAALLLALNFIAASREPKQEQAASSKVLGGAPRDATTNDLASKNSDLGGASRDKNTAAKHESSSHGKLSSENSEQRQPHRKNGAQNSQNFSQQNSASENENFASKNRAADPGAATDRSAASSADIAKDPSSYAEAAKDPASYAEAARDPAASSSEAARDPAADMSTSFAKNPSSDRKAHASGNFASDPNGRAARNSYENPSAATTDPPSCVSKECVSEHIRRTGTLPENFITKKQARELGYGGGDLWRYARGKSIGGDRFGNFERKLPDKKGRIWRECDVDYAGGARGAKRLVFSNDGLIFYTADHYESFERVR